MNSENINELITALSKAQGEMSAAAKDCNNPFYKSKYADLNSVWNACRDALSKNGLAVVQSMHKDERGEPFLRTTLGHSSGQWMSSWLPITPAKDGSKNELQALGSTLTYLRRYSLAAIVGVAPDEDDDGNNNNFKSKPQAKNTAAPITPHDITKEDALRQLALYNGESVNILQFLIGRCDKFKTTLKDEVEMFIASEELAMAEFQMWKTKQLPQKVK